MSDKELEGFFDNPDFNQWLIENYSVEIEEYEFPSSEVLFSMDREKYYEALARYSSDPKISLKRIQGNFPTPIAYYYYQASNNFQNFHHRLDLLKSCWESIIFFIFGLVVGEAIYRKLSLKSIGIKYDKFFSDRVYDKLTIVENILDHVTKNGIVFSCSNLIPLSTISLIRKLNQERNGFEHANAKTEAQQQELYSKLYPQLEMVLRELIHLEDVIVFRYHDAELTLYPRCEIFRGYSLEGTKSIVPINKDNYIRIMDYFNAKTIFVKAGDEVFCLAPFIHFSQEAHETNPVLCFYKQEIKGAKIYTFEVVSKSKNLDFPENAFGGMITLLETLTK